jgi:hypothetical protein
MEGNGGQHNLQRVAAALERAGARLDCPSCGGTAWARYPDVVFLPESRVEGEISAWAGIPTYVLICYRCGFVRLHSIKVLLDQAANATG